MELKHGVDGFPNFNLPSLIVPDGIETSMNRRLGIDGFISLIVPDGIETLLFSLNRRRICLA